MNKAEPLQDKVSRETRSTGKDALKSCAETSNGRVIDGKGEARLGGQTKCRGSVGRKTEEKGIVVEDTARQSAIDGRASLC